MKRSKLFMTLFIAGSLMATSLTGCGGDSGTDADTTAAPDTTAGDTDTDTTAGEDEDTTQGSSAASGEQVANLLFDVEPGTFDASKSTDMYSSMVLENTMVALTRPVFVDGVEVPTEDGAESIEVSDDGLVWTFNLRDFKWADGEPVTAHDYVFSLMRTLDPNTASQYAFLLDPIKGAHDYNTMDPEDAGFEDAKNSVGIVAKDDKTLEITLHSPCAYFKQMTYFKVFMPQRQDFVENAGTSYGADADKILCCGPYILTEWIHKDTIVLEKNHDYWDADSYPLETVNLRIIEDIETAYAEFEAGTVAAVNSVNKPEWFSIFEQRDDLTNFTQERADVVYMAYNESADHDSIMKNLKLRQAVSAAINREEAVQELYGGLTGMPAYDWVGSIFNLEPNLNYRELAGKEPVKRLQEEVAPDPKAHFIEGMQELGLGDDPSTVEIGYYSSTSSSNFAEYFQANLEEVLGCKINLDLSEWAQYQVKTNNYEHDILAQAWGADYNDPMTMLDYFKTGTNQSNTGMANAEFDDLINQAAALPADQNEERIKLLSQAENILLVEECAATPWAHRQRNGFKYNYLDGYEVSVFGALNLRGISIKAE